jgi:hypothetical protein
MFVSFKIAQNVKTRTLFKKGKQNFEHKHFLNNTKFFRISKQIQKNTNKKWGRDKNVQK